MTEPQQPQSEDLTTFQQRKERLADQIVQMASRIRSLIVHDIPRYLERETRTRWLQHVSFAEDMSDEQLSALKTDLVELGADLQTSIAKELSEPELWLSPDTFPSPGNVKSLRDNDQVWSVLQKIACQLSALLDEYGFPPDNPAALADIEEEEGETPPPYDLTYNSPKYFLEGEYCPGLVETYWNQLKEYRKVNRAIESAQTSSRRVDLEQRWEKV